MPCVLAGHPCARDRELVAISRALRRCAGASERRGTAGKGERAHRHHGELLAASGRGEKRERRGREGERERGREGVRERGREGERERGREEERKKGRKRGKRRKREGERNKEKERDTKGEGERVDSNARQNAASSSFDMKICA